MYRFSSALINIRGPNVEGEKKTNVYFRMFQGVLDSEELTWKFMNTFYYGKIYITKNTILIIFIHTIQWY